MRCLPLLALSAFLLPAGKSVEDGFVPLFDGKSSDGWTISAKSVPSAASKNKSGSKWVIEDRVIVIRIKEIR